MKTGTLGTTASLKSLHLSPYPNVFDFNIPKLVHGLDNLRLVWINAPIAPRISATSAPASIVHSPLVSQMPIVASDLRKEMFGTLPPKVRSITIAGKGFNTVAETILSVSVGEPSIAQTVFLPLFRISCREYCRQRFTSLWKTHRFRSFLNQYFTIWDTFRTFRSMSAIRTMSWLFYRIQIRVNVHCRQRECIWPISK